MGLIPEPSIPDTGWARDERKRFPDTRFFGESNCKEIFSLRFFRPIPNNVDLDTVGKTGGIFIFRLCLARIVTAMFIVIPILFSFHKRGEPTLASTYGWFVVISFVSIIFCFCGAQLFFYFIFASMPLALRVCGLTLVISSGAVWAVLCWRDHALATQRSGLMESAAYVEHPRYYVYDQFKAGDILNRHLHLRNPFSRPYLIGFLIIAPFGAFFYRFFGDHIGHHGMIWVLGFLAYPLYLFFIGAIIQVYRQAILIPRTLRRQKGKPVYWGA